MKSNYSWHHVWLYIETKTYSLNQKIFKGKYKLIKKISQNALFNKN